MSNRHYDSRNLEDDREKQFLEVNQTPLRNRKENYTSPKHISYKNMH
jgi:hypothetical protein